MTTEVVYTSTSRNNNNNNNNNMDSSESYNSEDYDDSHNDYDKNDIQSNMLATTSTSMMSTAAATHRRKRVTATTTGSTGTSASASTSTEGGGTVDNNMLSNYPQLQNRRERLSSKYNRPTNVATSTGSTKFRGPIRKSKTKNHKDILFAILITFIGTVMTIVTIFTIVNRKSNNTNTGSRKLSSISNLFRSLGHSNSNNKYDNNNLKVDHNNNQNQNQNQNHNHNHNQNHNQNQIITKHEQRMIDKFNIDELPNNPIYTIPESMSIVGDRSDNYISLRKEYDISILPKNYQRSIDYTTNLVQSNKYYNIPLATQENTSTSNSKNSSSFVPYDIHNCPKQPPIGYPYSWNIIEILNNWQPDDVQSIPSKLHMSLCIFDYTKDYDKAILYRNKEVPFITINDPYVARTVERWNTPNYIQRMLGQSTMHRTEFSQNNHFMFYVPVKKRNLNNKHKNHFQNNRNNQMTDKQRQLLQGRHNMDVPDGWTEPTKLIRMTFSDWLQHANQSQPIQPYDPHWYYRLIGCGVPGNEGTCDKDSSEYLFDELTFFQPRENTNNSMTSLHIVDPDEQKGIHCRFGMAGVIAENHFDASRNSIVVLGGSRRYILSHPNQCQLLALYAKRHPSARHSAVNWCNPDLTKYPEFNNAIANEVILLPGYALYLPTDWFHFIVSLELNYQCNTRSGITNDYSHYIKQCGF